MGEPRIEQAVRRIEAALGRIGEVADTINPAPPSVSSLVVRHENLREAVYKGLKELDNLIERMEN